MSVPSSTVASTARSARSAEIRAELARRTNSFTDLAQRVREAGLNNRTRWFYILVFTGLVVATAGAGVGLALLRGSWLVLLIAAALGVIFTQFAFLGHEASHRQVLNSGPANDRLGRVLVSAVVGMSYGWWMNKHNRHHGNPNKRGKDPDILPGAVVYTADDAIGARGPKAWVWRRQGWLFYPLLPFLGIDLHRESFVTIFGRRPMKGRAVEIVMVLTRFAIYLGVLFWLLPIGMAFAFLGVQLAVFGFYMGATFAPNHIGMPIVPADAKLNFLDKQVLTSRNVTGGWWMTTLMGGLNYQIEHHLFPAMPRPHLAKARRMVLEHCRSQDVTYTENSLPAALTIVVRHMNDVGLAAARDFRCPTAGAMGRP